LRKAELLSIGGRRPQTKHACLATALTLRRKRGHFLGRFTWLVGLDLGHLLSNAAFSF
jgi:hypothetical protein